MTHNGWGEGDMVAENGPSTGWYYIGGGGATLFVSGCFIWGAKRTDEDAAGEQLAVMAEVRDAEGEEDDGGGPFGRH